MIEIESKLSGVRVLVKEWSWVPSEQTLGRCPALLQCPWTAAEALAAWAIALLIFNVSAMESLSPLS